MSDTPCPLCGGSGLAKPVPTVEHIPAPLYAARAAQAKQGRLKFCTCTRGQMYRQYLLRMFYGIRDGRDKFPNWNDIEIAAATPTFNGG